MSERKFIITFAAVSLVVLALFYAFNRVMNPLHEYPTDIGLKYLWLGDTYYEDRQHKIFLYNRLPEPPEVIIFGNSRGRTLPVDIIEQETGLEAFNASVISSSTLEYLAFLRYFLDQPDNNLQVVIANVDIMLFIGVDTDALNRYPFLPYAEELDYPVWRAELERFRRTLSWEVTAISRQLFNANFLDPGSAPEQSPDANGVLWYPNEDEWTGPDPEHVAMLKESYRLNYAVELSDIPAENLRYFETWLEMMADEGICVNLVVGPLMTDVVLDLQENSNYDRLMAGIFGYLKGLQDEYPFQLYDFSTIDTFGGDDLWFREGSHFMRPNADLMMQQIIDNGLCGENRDAAQ